ncbi:MAG: UvrD-helicase domain-containing protein, partial [Gammaproteobacteria bacterium]|nr:UvrD-helicase domain-containing protein [Gammaproteobacteria bacterium]
MSSPNPILAASPTTNAIVKASAGVGKTYLLVTRLIRLLLQDVAPDSILAITFTRKAAAEMQSRLSERLYELAICNEEDARNLLENIGAKTDPASIHKAQSLYEKLLNSPRQVRAATFHSFCQDVLHKFPLEADVPPGFDLLDEAKIYHQTAWEMLYDEATQTPDGKLAKALETLFALTGSVYSTQESITRFLEQQADWWAFTADSEDPVDCAVNKLRDSLNIDDETENFYLELFNATQRQKIYRLLELWDLHCTPAQKKLFTALQHYAEDDVFITANLAEDS